MAELLGVILFCGIVVGAVLVFRFALKDRSVRRVGYRARRILSNPEQVLFHRMTKALPECIVLAQVELSRLLQPIGATNGREYFSMYGRLRGKSLDYIVCLKDFTVVAAIELDDSTHESDRRKAADTTKQYALESAGVPLVRWNVRDLPSVEQIRAAFARP